MDLAQGPFRRAKLVCEASARKLLRSDRASCAASSLTLSAFSYFWMSTSNAVARMDIEEISHLQSAVSQLVECECAPCSGIQRKSLLHGMSAHPPPACLALVLAMSRCVGAVKGAAKRCAPSDADELLHVKGAMESGCRKRWYEPGGQKKAMMTTCFHKIDGWRVAQPVRMMP